MFCYYIILIERNERKWYVNCYVWTFAMTGALAWQVKTHNKKCIFWVFGGRRPRPFSFISFWAFGPASSLGCVFLFLYLFSFITFSFGPTRYWHLDIFYMPTKIIHYTERRGPKGFTGYAVIGLLLLMPIQKVLYDITFYINTKGIICYL
jgi:hypothetical protein